MSTINHTLLRQLREASGLTQDEVGQRIGLTQSAYSKLETQHHKNSAKYAADLALVFNVPVAQLLGIHLPNGGHQFSGLRPDELKQIQGLLKEEPLRKDEFVLFTAPILELEKHDFRTDYAGLNMKDRNPDEPIPMQEYPPDMYLMVAPLVEIGTDYPDAAPPVVSVWLGDQKLGVIPSHQSSLVDDMITELLVSRVALIANEDGIPG